MIYRPDHGLVQWTSEAGGGRDHLVAVDTARTAVRSGTAWSTLCGAEIQPGEVWEPLGTECRACLDVFLGPVQEAAPRPVHPHHPRHAARRRTPGWLRRVAHAVHRSTTLLRTPSVGGRSSGGRGLPAPAPARRTA
jgi:hypothetical protein